MGGNQPEPLEIVPTGAALGAEVRGVDLSAPLPDDTVVQIAEAWADHLVLLFRSQQLTDDNILEFSNHFGGQQAAGIRQRYLSAGYKPGDHQLQKDARINYVSNLDKDGKPALVNSGIGSFEIRWHTDNSYTEVPPNGTLLWAEKIPDDNSGQTLFCNQYLAYDELPDDLKAAIDGKHQMHDSTRNTANRLAPNATMPKSREDIDGPVHPMVRIHPVTGRKALYLGRRWSYPSTYIVEMPTDEGEMLMDRLWAHATQEKYVWTHSWRPGDLLMWDNRCVMHRRTAINPTQPRVMHRTLIKGDPVISAWGEDSPTAVAR